MPRNKPYWKRLIQQEGLCGATIVISGHVSPYSALSEHSCLLSREHFGVHICYICQCAFNDWGDLLFQRASNQIDGILARLNKA
jgi:hypothetical protein